jgi:hypothetical protein
MCMCIFEKLSILLSIEQLDVVINVHEITEYQFRDISVFFISQLKHRAAH